MIPSTTRSHSFLSLIPNNTNIGQVNILRQTKTKNNIPTTNSKHYNYVFRKKNIKENNVDIEKKKQKNTPKTLP